MATESIFKEIEIKDRHSARKFVRALEQAEKTKGKHVKMSKPVIEVHGKDIKKLFVRSK
jgi:hypothetical protein